jgi:hypothetical protein
VKVSTLICPSFLSIDTISSQADFQNQGALELAKEYDPDGKRTIGEHHRSRLANGLSTDKFLLRYRCSHETRSHPDWRRGVLVSLIRNEKEPLDNNWYCVKQPKPSELKERITWTEARKREDVFFLTGSFSRLEPVYQKYLRTSNLVERLSSILSDLISKRYVCFGSLTQIL